MVGDHMGILGAVVLPPVRSAPSIRSGGRLIGSLLVCKV